MSPSEALLAWALKAEKARRRCLQELKRVDSHIYEVMLRLARQSATAGCPMTRAGLREAVKKALDLELCAETIDARIEDLREVGYLVIARSTSDRRKMIVTTSAIVTAKLDEMDA